MPNVTATTRAESNGQLTTSFITVAVAAPTTFTYPTQQNMLKLANKSVSSTMTLTVNGTNYTVPPDSLKLVYDAFTAFTIASQYDSQAFEAVTATNSTIAITGSNVKDYAAVTPNDTTDLVGNCIAIVVTGVVGNIVVIKPNGQEVTLPSGLFTTGQIVPFPVKRVKATGTTATGIWAVFT